MNNSIKIFTQGQILKGLSSLPEPSQRLFRLMYGRLGGKRSVQDAEKLSLEHVIVEIPEDRLDWALTQIENTHRKNAT